LFWDEQSGPDNPVEHLRNADRAQSGRPE
jgi:hypothetical protein